MTKEEIIVQFIVDCVKGIQKDVNENGNKYGDNDMVESLYIDSHLSYWYKNALDKVPTFTSLLNIAPNDVADLIKGIYNLAYEMYFDLDADSDESFTLEYNSNLILSSLDKARMKLNEKQVLAMKEFDLFNVEDWKKPEVQGNKIFQLQKEIISRTLKQATSVKQGLESFLRKESENIMPFYDSAYKLWSSQERIKQISERIDISEEVALASVEEAFVFIKQKGNSITKDMRTYLKKEENIENLIQQIFDSTTKKFGEGGDIAYVYFDHIQEIEKFKPSLITNNKYQEVVDLTVDCFCLSIMNFLIETAKYDYNNPNANEYFGGGFLVEDIQNYRYGKNRYEGYTSVLKSLSNLTESSKKLKDITSTQDGLNETYKRQCKEKEKSCYIATMAYQDINHPQVEYLRQVRDKKLLNYHWGQIFVKYYYKYSPILVERLKNYQNINRGIRKGLDSLIFILKK